MITGKTKILGLIGNPVTHTISPLLHNAMAKISGIDCVYTAFLVQNSDLKDAIRGAHALGVLGLNVTVPYKTEVMPFLEDIDMSAMRIGAVNTLKRTDTGYIGYNTDADGLAMALDAHHCPIAGQDVVVLGAGGAARAAVHMAAAGGAKSVVILNRDRKKAENLRGELDFFKGLVRALPMEDYRTLCHRGKQYFAIQATSMGMEPNVGSVITEDIEWYKCLHTVYDCVYKPRETLFMKYAKEAGAAVYNGLTMLLYQAVKSFEIWNDVSLRKEDIEKVLYPLLL